VKHRPISIIFGMRH